MLLLLAAQMVAHHGVNAVATDKHVAKKYWTYWEETARSAGALAGL